MKKTHLYYSLIMLFFFGDIIYLLNIRGLNLLSLFDRWIPKQNILNGIINRMICVISIS